MSRTPDLLRARHVVAAALTSVLVSSLVLTGTAAHADVDPADVEIVDDRQRVRPLGVAATDVVAVFGSRSFGSPAELALRFPLVGLAPTPTGNGYWLVAADGGIFAYGDAVFFGSTGNLTLNQPIVGMAAHPAGKGYWFVAADGGIFAFGDARFFGSTGSQVINQPIVGMAASPTGNGYWLVARDGGIFAFGDARFFGSTGGSPLLAPVVGVAATPSGSGYWLAARDGGIFAFGDAAFLGRPVTQGMVAAIAVAPGGYATVDNLGVVSTFGVAAKATIPPVDLAGDWPVGIGVAPTGSTWVVLGRGRELVTVGAARQLDAATIRSAVAAANDVGGFSTVVHAGTIGLYRVMRGGAVVQAAPPGMRYPMASTAIDPAAAVELMSPEVGRVLSTGQVVMGSTSAALRGAQVGDVVEFLGWNGAVSSATIGLVADDADVGSIELLFADGVAASFGFVRPSSVRIWGYRSRAAIEFVLGRRLGATPGIRVRRSWDAPSPDRVLDTAELKRRLGEFAFSGGGNSISPEAGWVAANIVTEPVPLIGLLRCHRTIMPALRGALGEVAAAGLAGAIDLADTRRNGGCYVPREIRSPGSNSGGSLSRHSWGIAVDINPRTNAFGATPRIDPRVVAIFRRWGFAWGGGFTIPDGMHFEWVGEPRE